MALSLYDQIALLPASEREEWVKTLPDQIADDLARQP